MPIRRVMFPDIDQIVARILADLSTDCTPLPVEPDVQASPHSIFIANHVVSLAVIQNVSATVDELVITPKAVITPLARDEIRKRRLAVAVRLEQTNTSPHTDNVSLRLFSTPDSKFSLRLAKFGNIARPLPLQEVLDSIEKHLARTNSFCVLLTGQSASAMYEACRRNSIRPVLGIDVRQTADDINEINANLLILPKILAESKIAAILEHKRQTASV